MTKTVSYESERKRFNGEILDGIVIIDSDDGELGRIIITKDGKAWGFDKCKMHFIELHKLRGERARETSTQQDDICLVTRR